MGPTLTSGRLKNERGIHSAVLIVRESEEENKMKIKLNSELIANVMMVLRQRGEDPNDYFEIGVETGTTLVEGQTRLTEFIQPQEKVKKVKKVKKGKKGTKASKSNKKLTPKESKETWDDAVAERLASLVEGEDTFRRIIAMCPHPSKQVDFKKAAEMLHNASTDKSIWLTKVKRNPSGTAVRSVYTWLQRNQRTKIKNKIKVRKDVVSNKHLYNEDNPWTSAEIDWMQSNYETRADLTNRNKLVAVVMFYEGVSPTERKAWEVRNMATNLGLN